MPRPEQAHARASQRGCAARTALFVIDWDAQAGEDLGQRLEQAAAPHRGAAAGAHRLQGQDRPAWQVLNCAASALQAGQGRTWRARVRLGLRYFGTAAVAHWRSRGQAQTVVWQQAIAYLMCLLPRWPAWACPAGQRAQLVITTVLLSPSSTAPWSWGRLLLELALRRADRLVYFSRDMALDTARCRPALAHKVFWMPLPQFGEPAQGPQNAAAARVGAPRPLAARAGALACAPNPPSALTVFAGGSSDRDFDVVIEAFREGSIPVTIVCREDQRFRHPGPAGAHFIVRRGVSETEYHALAAAAGVVVVALKSASSGCGQLLLSFCMRHGIPLIATDSCGTRDEVIHGRTGWLVPAGDAQALRQAYERLAADPGLRDRLVHNARARAQAQDIGLPGFVQAMENLRHGGSRVQAPGSCVEGHRGWPESALAILNRAGPDAADHPHEGASEAPLATPGHGPAGGPA